MHFCIQFSVKRCKVCPLTFLTKSEMQIHSKSHTEAKPHKCPHCSKTFANASYLSQHLRIHLGIKPYHCSYCENSFRQLSHLQQHTRSVQLWTRSSLVRSGVKENKIATEELLHVHILLQRTQPLTSLYTFGISFGNFWQVLRHLLSNFPS